MPSPHDTEHLSLFKVPHEGWLDATRHRLKLGATHRHQSKKVWCRNPCVSPSGLITSKCRPAPNHSHLHDSDGSGRNALTTLLRTKCRCNCANPTSWFRRMLKVALDQRDTRLTDRWFPLSGAASAQNDHRESGAHPRLHLARRKTKYWADATHGSQTVVPAAKCSQRLHLAQ